MDISENKLKYFVLEVQRIRNKTDVQIENVPISDIIKVYKKWEKWEGSN